MNTSIPALITFERILIPTDFSDTFKRVWEYAKSVAMSMALSVLSTSVTKQTGDMVYSECALRATVGSTATTRRCRKDS